MDRCAALGGIQAVGSFGRIDEDGTWRHHGACVEAKRSGEGGVGVRSTYGDLDENAPPMGLYLNFSIRGSGVFSRAKSLDYIKRGGA